jgi:hypothetical protein
MIFSNPFILFALIAVSLPILIHLFNLKKVRKIEFSTLMFLKEIQKSKIKKIKLKQLILLLLRILIITFLVFSFSDPVLTGYKEGNSKINALILIDDSFSMGIRDENGTALEHSTRIVNELSKLFNSDDKILIVKTSELLMKNKTTEAENIPVNYSDSMITYTPFEVENSFNYIQNYFAKSTYSIREVFIISDFRKSNFRNFDIKSVNTKLSVQGIKLFLLDVSDREGNNISVDNIYLKSLFADRNSKVKISTEITNNSKNKVENKVVKLIIEGNEITEKVIDLNPEESRLVDFEFNSMNKNILSGFIYVVQNLFKDDELIYDNRYYFSLTIPDYINIGLYNGKYANDKYINLVFETANKYLRDSLNSKNEYFRVNKINQLSDNILSNDALILNDNNEFSNSDISLLKEFVKTGKGIFIFPGRYINIEENNKLLESISGLSITGLKESTDFENKIVFDKIDYQNPVFEGVFQNIEQNVSTQIESPVIKYYYKINETEKSHKIITLNNSDAFLIESSVGNSKILFSAVSSDLLMSDFPSKSIFATVLLRGIQYLSCNELLIDKNIIGNDNIVKLNKNNGNITGILIPDSKSVISFSGKSAATKIDYISIPYCENTLKQGIYTLCDSLNNRIQQFALNCDSSESNLIKADKEFVQNYFEKKGFEFVRYLNGKSSVNEMIIKSRNGYELWKYLLLLSVLFMLIEIYYFKKLEKGL